MVYAHWSLELSDHYFGMEHSQPFLHLIPLCWKQWSHLGLHYPEKNLISHPSIIHMQGFNIHQNNMNMFHGASSMCQTETNDACIVNDKQETKIFSVDKLHNQCAFSCI